MCLINDILFKVLFYLNLLLISSSSIIFDLTENNDTFLPQPGNSPDIDPKENRWVLTKRVVAKEVITTNGYKCNKTRKYINLNTLPNNLATYDLSHGLCSVNEGSSYRK